MKGLKWSPLEQQRRDSRHAFMCKIIFNLAAKHVLQQTIRIYHECEGRIENSVPRIAVWHHEACRVILFDLIQSFSYKETGPPGLNQY